MSDISADEYIEQQQLLEGEAKSSMPWNPNNCTYTLGPLRQQVFACRDHNKIGVCYSCSIQCHTRCDIVELFTKRNFTCDCGTERDGLVDADNGFRCQLRQNKEADIPASDNSYGHNFDGLFCICEKEYNPDSDSVMLQCIMGTECDEDWYHDYCIMNLDENKVERLPLNDDDEGSEKIVKGFPPLDSFDGYICWKCIKKSESFFKLLESQQNAEELIATKLYRNGTIQDNETDENTEITKKRKLDLEEIEYSLLLKPNYSETLKKIISTLKDEDNNKLLSFIENKMSHLVDEEPIYEPQEDQDINLDSYGLASDMLQSTLPHGMAIEGLVAFQKLKTKLSSFFKEFAENGEIVKEEDIKKFFEKKEDTE
ncbi:hypothetical protein Kpol_1007p7 [Vanderwaltozyma polyspora DSM 70294]|uniref:UBR-type domain-containing protein n=1 Tax=Vanderwaltozyma polyspora (strain ATCC 22028 / DSM 70294 / BCRC 21397 / CBS 2163 / NBRC 10782 / NRRL Y-8283 / UCD 57-17) TaxID=436907 RepID=A7TRS9_VANPO|nr:uncharacterized protein Kpol_1007p7 [Vanderwaltozyma polyspora DSM 70294]EDO15023.1 hypothetical protein Kpol_1007p7 [Vanderwaltozyma polyspora DSM 70294]